MCEMIKSYLNCGRGSITFLWLSHRAHEATLTLFSQGSIFHVLCLMVTDKDGEKNNFPEEGRMTWRRRRRRE